MFDPESKVKFMLEGLANMYLRSNADGVLTDYKKMKIGKYELPLSACTSALANEVYSERQRLDNGEDESRMQHAMEELARKYDEAKAKKTPKREQKPKPQRRPTRRQKIEAARRELGIIQFLFARVDTEGKFSVLGQTFQISEEATQYAPTYTKSGEAVYEMDQVLCGVDGGGQLTFFDMNIDKISMAEVRL